MSRTSKKYVVCVKNRGYRVSLERRKIYELVPDEKALNHNLLRVIDESGDDYLYPADFFIPIKLSASIESTFSRR
jgi:hypothetical protein